MGAKMGGPDDELRNIQMQTEVSLPLIQVCTKDCQSHAIGY